MRLSPKGFEILPQSNVTRSAMLIHGYGQSAIEMLPLGVRLAGFGYRVVASDLPGHGVGTDILDLQSARSAVLKDWNLFKPDLCVGFSLGARLGYELPAEKWVAISPPTGLAFDATTRREVLGVLRPRWVRESKPMAGLAECLQGLASQAVFPERGLTLAAGRDLSSVCPPDWSLSNWVKIENCDHLSIMLSQKTWDYMQTWLR